MIAVFLKRLDIQIGGSLGSREGILKAAFVSLTRYLDTTSDTFWQVILFVCHLMGLYAAIPIWPALASKIKCLRSTS